MRIYHTVPRFGGSIVMGNSKRSRSVFSGRIPTRDIVRELRPLDDKVRALDGYTRDEYNERVTKEISRAFAETITKQLQNEFGWQARAVKL